MFKIILVSKIIINFKIILIIKFFLLIIKKLILLFVKFKNCALKIIIRIYINNIFAFIIDKISTKI